MKWWQEPAVLGLAGAVTEADRRVTEVTQSVATSDSRQAILDISVAREAYLKAAGDHFQTLHLLTAAVLNPDMADWIRATRSA